MKPRAFVALFCLLPGLLAARSAEAQISRAGETFLAFPAAARGSAIAYDSVNNVFFVVSAHGGVNGRFVSADGLPLGDIIPLQGVDGFGQFPHVAYSPDLGAFLVTWYNGFVRARLISYTAGFLSGDVAISPGAINYEVMGAPVAYSTGSKEFLVVWSAVGYTTIQGVRIGTSGIPISAAFTINDPTVKYRNQPSLAYNPARDEFLVAYVSGYPGPYTVVQRVKAGSGEILTAPTPLGQGTDIFTTGVSYNIVTGEYLVAWYNGIVNGRVVSADGAALGNVVPLSTRYGTYDSLSVSHNTISGTALLAGHDTGGTTEVGGVEINGGGVPISAATQFTAAGGTGNFHPRLAPSTTRREWMLSAANSFTKTIAQRMQTASTSTSGVGGGGGGTPPPPSCSYSASASAVTLGSIAGSGTVTLTTGAGCPWTAVSTESWLALGDNAGSGPTTITIGYAANPLRQARGASILIGGRKISFVQAGAPEYLADFDSDGRGDIVWQNRMDGRLSVWRMNETDLVSSAPLGPGAVPDTAWKIVGTPDLNRDGQADLLWQHDGGLLAVWFMRGESLISGQAIIETPVDPKWRIVATGDLDRDTYTDFLWQHEDGTVAVWYMEGVRGRSGAAITKLADSDWRVVAAADFNGDSKLDLVWKHRTDGRVALWYMNDRAVLSGAFVNYVVGDDNWEIVGIGDFDSNTRPDLLWRHRTSGALAAWLLDGATLVRGLSLSPASLADTNWMIVGPR